VNAEEEFQKLSNMADIHVLRLKHSEHDAVMDWFSIEGFPSIFIHKNSNWSKYSGSYTAAAIYAFANATVPNMHFATKFTLYDCKEEEENFPIQVCSICPTVVLYTPVQEPHCPFCVAASSDFNALQTKDGLHVYRIQKYQKNFGEHCPTIYVYYPSEKQWYLYNAMDRNVESIWHSVFSMANLQKVELVGIRLNIENAESHVLNVCKDCPTYVVLEKEHATLETTEHVMYLNIDNDKTLVDSFKCPEFPSTFKYDPIVKKWSKITSDAEEVQWFHFPNVK
jgi:hypothetical protein